jgi:Arc/MetJ-type ribon-helix-helix transcriptional regulator
MSEDEKQTQKTDTGEEIPITDDSKEKRKNVLEEFGDSVGRFASKTFETIKHTIDKSLDSRNTVLTIRVNDEANRKLKMLVDAGIFKSRSESAAFLIEEGIKHQQGLFQKISEKLKKIEKIKDELKDIITNEMSEKKEG